MLDHPLAIPLDAHQVRRLEQLEGLAGEAYTGWGRDALGDFFVDVAGRRHLGRTLHGAIGYALRASGAA